MSEQPNHNATRSEAEDDKPKPWRIEGLTKKPTPTKGGDRPKLDWRRILSVALAGYLVTFLAVSLLDVTTAPKSIAYTEFQAQMAAQNVKSVYARGDTIQGELKSPKPLPDATPATEYTQFTTERPNWAKDDPLAELTAGGAVVRATPIVEQRGLLGSLLTSILPMLILIGLYLAASAWLMRRQLGGGGVGGLMGKKFTPVAEDEAKRVTFDDVAGIDEVEEQVTEIVDFLKNPGKYTRLGARAPKGVLLTGAPGTGKTLLARATAGEAGVPFFSASAAEFIEMIVGVGAQRVRQLFEEARKAAPAIIFIDEIDTIGRARGGGRALGGNDEREQTLNQILTEMDGFDGTEGVVIMAATNRADVLDPALTRPGRFDREITVHAPDRTGRVQILQVHMRKVPLAPDVDVEALAKSTPGMTGADLANLVNEAAILAAKRGADAVAQADFFNALEKVQLGVARHVVMPPDERRLTAYHEAGHALLGMLQKGADPVRKISIIPRGRALGVTLSTPEEDKYGYDADYLRGRIIGALGGLAAEQITYGKTTTGVDSDLEMATAIARQMVGRWGMSDRIGPMSVLSNEGDPRMLGISDATLAQVDEEARRIITDCLKEARQLLSDHKDKLDAIVSALLEKETLDEDEAYAAAGIERTTAA
nr:ATP-dependent zinc metalloprotease FtsH [Propionibacterium sp.]